MELINKTEFVILGIAVLALILSLINYFRISKIKKAAQIIAHNQKEDINMIKASVMSKKNNSRNRNYRRPNNNNKQNTNNKEQGDKISEKQRNNSAKQPNGNAENKNENPAKKQHNNKRKYTPRKPKQDDVVQEKKADNKQE